MDPLPYRFEFETDEQYEARTGISIESISAQPPETVSIVATPPADTAPRSGSFLFLPWWLIVIILLMAFLGFYESYRRRLTKILHQQHKKLEDLGRLGTTAEPAVVAEPLPPVIEIPTEVPPGPPVAKIPSLSPPEIPTFIRQRLDLAEPKAERSPTEEDHASQVITPRRKARAPVPRRKIVRQARRP